MDLNDLLRSDGPLCSALPGFEVRTSQLHMLTDVQQAFQDNRVVLVEAGTGTGKSLAYLVPALFWALEHNEKVVVSTNTIALQEQLLTKDIPSLLKAFDLDVNVVLVKGMNNYLCRRKIEDAASEKRFLSERERVEIEKIEESVENYTEGSRAELPFVPLNETWERVGAEGENCTHVKCPYYKHCFFFKARQESLSAHLLVVNHHLLCADLVARSDSDNYHDTCVLPAYPRLILDEAHHIEEIATEYFAQRVSRSGINRLLGRLSAERTTGKLKVLYQRIIEAYPSEKRSKEVQNWLDQLDLFLPAEKRTLHEHMEHVFQSLERYAGLWEMEDKLRFRNEHFTHPVWVTEVQPLVNECVTLFYNWIQSILNLIGHIEKDPVLKTKCEGIGAEIQGTCHRLQGNIDHLKAFVFESDSPNQVRWMEGTGLSLALITAQLDISTFLSQGLFQKLSTVVLCSATLATNQDFRFIRKNLGISNPVEKIYPSPFDYSAQSILAVPHDMPEPNDPRFVEEAAKRIESIVSASRGNAFVLFTSFHMLHACQERLNTFFHKEGYRLLCQGEESRQNLLERFRKTEGSVLFGTDSFWEGVDVAGDALRNVIIAKLPFKVPSEPLFQARSEAIEASGGSPFFEYSLPHAIMKFKQGFGRLIRTSTDRGCVVCLDPRLIKKSYGKQFLKSLPPSRLLVDKTETIVEEMKRFYSLKT